MRENSIFKILSVLSVSCLFFMGIVSFSANELSAAPEFKWHGQFRVNYYSDFRGEDSTFGKDNRSAARLRWRPTIDVDMSDSVSVHTQFNIGHINSNIYNACGSGNDCFMIRHAVIKADLFDTGVTGLAGLVPISDKFGDTLFSADWDFNPLALVFEGEAGSIGWRLGTGKLSEGTEGGLGVDDTQNDDLDIYVFDVDHSSSGLGGSVYWLHGGEDRTALSNFSGKDLDLFVYGVRYSGDLSGIQVNVFALGSSYQTNDFFASGDDLKSNGYAGKLEVKVPVQDMTVGIMGIYGTGDKNFGVDGEGTAGSFITPMSLAGTTGYWGYTGRLTEQGPTDTGIDDHTVNIDGGGLPWSSYSNLGYGLWTIQVKLSAPINDVVSTYFGVGYYASAETPSGQDDYIGTDVYGQGKVNLGENLNLEAGVDYLDVGKGHYNNVALNKSRAITTIFSRLQLEY